MNISRTWATPAAFATLAITSLTGVLMFFHLSSPLQKGVHEWIGFGVIAAIVLHTMANKTMFKAQFFSKKGAVIVGILAVLLIGSSFVGRSEREGKGRASPAQRALSEAPLRALAPLAKRPVEAIVADLVKEGYPSATADSTMGILSGGQPKKETAVQMIVFR